MHLKSFQVVIAFEVTIGGVKTGKCDEYILLEIMCNRYILGLIFLCSVYLPLLIELYILKMKYLVCKFNRMNLKQNLYLFRYETLIRGVAAN